MPLSGGANAEWTAPVVEWNREKGYGFLLMGGQRLFLHRRELIGPHCMPVIGDVIRFHLGMDEHGRACAVKAINTRGGLGVSLGSLIILAVLLVLPVMAALKLKMEPLWLVAGAVAVSAVTYGLYASDKRRAGNGQWRVPESQLHLLELLGGWPGAWLAQRRLRHKTSKRSYQMIFWMIVMLWQFGCYDSLQGWKVSRRGWDELKLRAPGELRAEV